jgi:ATP-dependent DNA helicase RecG
VTIAGLLAIAEHPETYSPSARVAYRVAPLPTDPPGSRFSATHLEGPVGSLLDAVLRRLYGDLRTVQVEQGGGLVDESDVPRRALREIVANALLHRSLTEAREPSSTAVEVMAEAVVVTSPGGLHPASEPSQLGLTVLSNVRNHTLVRICEELRSPDGQRIVENQASGIRNADEACRRAGTMPPLFVDLPAQFQVYLLRGALLTDEAQALLAGTALKGDADAVRVVSAAHRLGSLRDQALGSPLARHPLDARFAARLLSPSAPEDAAALLLALERASVLARRRTRRELTWIIAAAPTPRAPAAFARRTVSKSARIEAVVTAIAGSDTGVLTREEIGAVIERTAPRSQAKWINEAIEAGYAEATHENVYHPRRAYRLTTKGRGLAERRSDR